jgi:putative membrane-bound dehydrogenase-like protein
LTRAPSRLRHALVASAAAAGVFALACARQSARERKDAALPAAEALRSLEVENGFDVQLFAAEPDVVDPVAMDIDEDGRVFVVEMPGYPLDTSPSGRVKLLEDTNGDGRPDRSSVFADGLVMPTGVMRWKKGILVTAAPDLLYFEDRDRDGRAEVREVVVTGFASSNPQHTVNNPIYGLDNWIHLAHEGPATAIVFAKEFGDEGGPLRFPARPDVPPVVVGDSAVRLRPDAHRIEARSGNTQFGHSFDEWGRYFTLDNANHGRHEVIAARYLRRNPDLLLSSAMQHMSDHGDAAKVFPANPNPRVEMLTEHGEMTSACGLTVYLGGLFAPAFHRAVFVAEPVHNLVHRDVLRDAGASFTASRATQGREFLASTDGWFRPVNFHVGPDGALYVVDYYRKSIEHPEWAARDAAHSPDLYFGRGQGRIYRVTPAGRGAFVRFPRLGAASDDELVAQLSHANAWWRRTAQRLLVDRANEAATALLARLAREGPSLGRLHALWTLDGLGRLETSLIEAALGAPEPGLRENAIRLAEENPERLAALTAALQRLADDPDPKVRYQLSCALGSLRSPEARGLRRKLLLSDLDDPWMHSAALSADSAEALAWFDAAPADTAPIPPAFFKRAAAVVGARGRRAEVRRLLQQVAQLGDRTQTERGAATLEGLADGIRARRASGKALAGSALDLLALARSGAASIRGGALALLEVAGLPDGSASNQALAAAARTARDASAEPASRADALRLLGLGPAPPIDLLDALLDPNEPEEVARAAARTLGRVKGEDVGRRLLARWRTMSPAVRGEAADALQRDPARLPLLMDALEKREVQGWTLNFGQKRRLLMHRDPALRERARLVLAAAPAERARVLAGYEAALRLDGDATRGLQVFQAACARCHRRDGQGADVGPDLGTVRNRPVSVLLVDILDPSRAIAQGYEAWVVQTRSGETHEGVLAAQTQTSVTLRREGVPDVVIARAAIERMNAANLSAMPADLENQISVAQMADLLRYLTARN